MEKQKTCTECDKPTQQFKCFIYQGKEKRLCPECYKPYYLEGDKRVSTSRIPEKIKKITKLIHQDYVDGEGKPIEMVVELD